MERLVAFCLVVCSLLFFACDNQPGLAKPTVKEDETGKKPGGGKAREPLPDKGTGEAGVLVPSDPPADKPPKKQVKQDAQAVLVKYLNQNGVFINRKKKMVWVEGKVQITNDYLEYVVVALRGKDHESLLVVDCLPSALNAALLAIGLKKGKNYSLKERLPRPPIEDVKSGKVKPYVVVHPSGPSLYLTVAWQGKDGALVQKRVEDLILDLQTQKQLEPRTWVYFGSRMAPINKGEKPVFMADAIFNLVSVCYMAPSNHLITIKHKNGMDQGNWYPNYEALPKKGTPVKLYFSIAPLSK